MVNEIIIGIIMIAVYLAVRYLVKAKVRGQRCVGCPYAGCCGKTESCDGEKYG